MNSYLDYLYQAELISLSAFNRLKRERDNAQAQATKENN